MPDPAADLPRLLRLLKISLGVNIGMVAVNAGVLYALLVFVVNEPADVDGVVPQETEAQDGDAQEKGDPREEMRLFFNRTSSLLDRAARKHGGNPLDVLPARDAIERAVETRTIHSDESQEVMQKLREGFDYYNLDWPTVIPER